MKLKSLCSAALLIAGIALFVTSIPVFSSESLTSDSTVTKTFEQTKRFELGPFVGYHFFEDKQNLKDSFTYGGRVGYNFTKHFGVEASMAVVKADVDDKTKTGAFKGQYRFPTDSVDLTSYQVNAIYQFNPERRFTPFVTAGIGKISYDPEVLGNDMNTFDYGVGAKYWMQRDMALRVDLKDQMDSSFHNYSATIELVFAVGGRSKNTPAPVVRAEPIPEPTEVVLVSEESPKVEEKVVTLTAEPIEGKTIVLAFEDVHFNFDKSTLTDAAKVILKRSIQILKDNPKVKVRIAGYTSASGTDEYNQRLSERRSKAVINYLVDEGVIAPDRLTTIGYGEDHPAEYEASPKQLYSKAAMANMRVLFETIIK